MINMSFTGRPIILLRIVVRSLSKRYSNEVCGTSSNRHDMSQQLYFCFRLVTLFLFGKTVASKLGSINNGLFLRVMRMSLIKR